MNKKSRSSKGLDVEQFAIVAEGIEKRFGDNLAVAGVDLSVRTGEIYGFLGRTAPASRR